MGLQGLSLRRVQNIERHTGLTVLRATVNNGTGCHRWNFVTADHRHGWIEPRTGHYAWFLDAPDAGEHTSPLCDELFGDPPRVRDDSWGWVCPDGIWRVWQAGTRRPDQWSLTPDVTE
jgi:hypothetical protein